MGIDAKKPSLLCLVVVMRSIVRSSRGMCGVSVAAIDDSTGHEVAAGNSGCNSGSLGGSSLKQLGRPQHFLDRMTKDGLDRMQRKQHKIKQSDQFD